MMMFACMAILALARPCFEWLDSGQAAMQLAALGVLNLCLGMLLSCILAQTPSLFPLKVRFMARALSYNVSIAFFAGTAPMINA